MERLVYNEHYAAHAVINMKKTICFTCIFSLLSVLCLSFLSGCGPSPSSGDKKIGVIVSILPLQEFVEKVGGDKVQVSVMVPPGADPHSFEPKPRQLQDVARAKMYVKAGSGIEFELNWMKKLLENNRDIVLCDASSGIILMPSDPHAWASLRNAVIMVNNIKRTLISIDPKDRDYFTTNAIKYNRELRNIDYINSQVLKRIKKRAFIVFHPDWGYFARDYGLTQKTIEIEGKEPKAGDLAALIGYAKKNGIRVIFASPQFSTRSASVIAAQINGAVVVIDPLSKQYASNMAVVAREMLRALK